MTGTKTDLTSPIYHDDDAARAHLEALLWPQGAFCPRCGVTGDRVTKLQGKSTRPGVYKCKDCRKPFTVTVGTVMERSKVPLSKWVLAAHYVAASKKGMGAHQLHRMLGTNHETAWFLFRRLREAATDKEPLSLGGENAVVEADETYIGGREHNKHAWQRLHAGRGPVGKIPVVALVERDGRTRRFHVAKVTSANLREIMTKHVNAKTHIMTDESAVYPAVTKAFAGHSTVNHSAEEYVRLAGSSIPTRSRAATPCSSAGSTARSTTSAKRTCRAISPSSISAPTPRISQIASGQPDSSRVPRASGWSTPSLVEPKTRKQIARRKRRLSRESE